MISAVLRLKNEAEWLPICLKSIIDIFDEILLCTQGPQDDDTYSICLEWQKDYPTIIKHFHYPHDSRPNGPGHDKQPMDEYNRAQFYNWCFNKAKDGNWLCKWDGDMIALPGCKEALHEAVEKGYILKFRGIDVVGDIYHIGDREFCAEEARLYKKGHYIAGPKSEKLIIEEPKYSYRNNKPLFIHTKWAKSEYSITKAWPENWRKIEHFQKIWERNCPKKLHDWEIPKWLREDAGKL